MKTLKLKTYAKLNLTLDICGKREDGYHLLDSVMVSVEPYDTVTISKSDIIKVSCSDKKLSSENNIAFIAAKEFFDYTGISGGADIYIEKRIPQAAGLGGGSSDAAAVIRGLDRLFGTSLSFEEMREIGLRVGADVPFCIEGGVARAEGIGERVKKLPDINGLWLILIKQGEKASTRDMYSKIDNAEAGFECTTSAAVDAVMSGDTKGLVKNISNHFALVSSNNLEQFDELSKCADAFSLSGSGPTVFAAFCDKNKAIEVFSTLKDNYNNCFLTDIKPYGIEFV